MVERPDSEPSLAEAIASFHPHKPASPKHKAGVLKRGGCERNGSSGPLLGLTCATEREWRDEKRPDCAEARLGSLTQWDQGKVSYPR